MTDPVTTATGTRITGLRIGERRSHSLLTALPMFTLQTQRFPQRGPAEPHRAAPRPGPQAGHRRADDIRPKTSETHHLIKKIPHSNRYHVTGQGLTDAMFLSAIYDRLLPTGLAELHTEFPAPIRAAAHAYQQAIQDRTRTTGLAA